jgi:hypothetical protein
MASVNFLDEINIAVNRNYQYFNYKFYDNMLRVIRFQFITYLHQD